MVTAELALTLPAVVLVLVICLSALSWGVDRVRCVDAARVAVREIARGEDPGRALDDARALAPEGASVILTDPATGLPVDPVVVDRRTGRPLEEGVRVAAGPAASDRLRRRFEPNTTI